MNPIKRHMIKVAGYMIIIVNGKILLRKRHNVSYQNGMYDIPAGHVEEGESPLICAKRETLEEVNITVTETEFSTVMFRKGESHINDDYTDFFFIAKTFTGIPKNNEPDKCSEILFADIYNLPKNISLHVKIAIDNMLTYDHYYLNI